MPLRRIDLASWLYLDGLYEWPDLSFSKKCIGLFRFLCGDILPDYFYTINSRKMGILDPFMLCMIPMRNYLMLGVFPRRRHTGTGVAAILFSVSHLGCHSTPNLGSGRCVRVGCFDCSTHSPCPYHKEHTFR